MSLQLQKINNKQKTRFQTESKICLCDYLKFKRLVRKTKIADVIKPIQ